LAQKSNHGSKNVGKELYNAELEKYKKSVEHFPTLSKYLSPLVKDIYKKTKENENVDASVTRYASLAAVNLILHCTISAHLSLIKAANTPRVLSGYTGVTMGALVGVSDVILNMIDAATMVDLIKAAIDVVRSIPKMVRSTKIAVEKYARAVNKQQASVGGEEE
jgi:hypothetical protein